MVPIGAEHTADMDPANTGPAFLRRRFGQIGLDAVVRTTISVLLAPLVLPLAWLVRQFGVSGFAGIVTGFCVTFLVTMVFAWWWHVWFPYRHGDQTPAMRWLKLRLIGMDGDKPGLGQYNARWVLTTVDTMFFCLVGIVLIIVTPQHQRAGDIVARTRVVRADVN
ncbi:RDD family protein [Saccharopolyspora gloriosae]|uniref:RDD family protein n=1 Tax=Saccharopolyspora gloriosae TaxID=455344 RepID=UPI001FB7DCD8|nr:RDD family protein [Saccharopolyspora gloriosae]